MPPILRSASWNVHIYNSKDPTEVIGGLCLANGITNANFYAMIEIIIIFSSTFFLRNETGIEIEKNDDQLQPGKYYIVASGEFIITLNKYEAE